MSAEGASADTNYAGVWHLPNGTTLFAADSTANGRNGTIGSPVATAGEIGGGASFNGASGSIAFNPITNLAQTYTAEFWINSSFPNAYMSVLGGSSGFNDIYFDNGHNVLGVDNGTSFSAYSTATVSGLNVPSNTWTSLAVTRSGSSISVYKNGALVGTGTFSTPYNAANFAEMGNAAGINYYGGKLDEVKISSSVRPAAWIQTEYSNQSSPSAFLNVGAAQSSSGNMSRSITAGLIKPSTGITAPSDSAVVSTGSDWYDAAWPSRKAITINSGQVNGTLTNFPLLYSVTDANLIGTTQLNGNDILFTASDGVTKLNHEIESFDSTTGTLVAWVRVPQLGAGTLIYAYWGNSAAPNQQSAAGVWDSNFDMVQHFGNGTALSTNDSTRNECSASLLGATLPAPGEIAGAASFSGGSIDFGPCAALGDSTAQTISLWVKARTGMAEYARLIEIGSNQDWSLLWNYIGGSNRLSLHGLGGTANLAMSANPVADNAWHKVDVTSGAGGNVAIYIDGVLSGQGQAPAGPLSSSAGTIRLGQSGAGGYYYFGLADELRISNIARSADWIAAEFNSEKSPAGFFTVGPLTNR